MRLFHLAFAADWAAARGAGRYTVSTRGRTLAEEGFIHLSRADQWQGVRSRFYADVELAEPLVLLVIDADRLTAPVVEEPGSSEPGAETFPHLYGALDVDAVVQVVELAPGSTPAVPATSEPPAPPESSASFGRLFAQEVAVRMVMAIVVMVLAVAGALLGGAVVGDAGEVAGLAIGLVVGAAVGVAVAVTLHRRWRVSRRDPRPRPHRPHDTVTPAPPCP